MWRCIKCQASNDDSLAVCWSCSTSKHAFEESSLPRSEDAEFAPRVEAPTISDQEITSLAKSCPHCNGSELYVRRMSMPESNPLAGLGWFLHFAQFDVVICAGCGLMRFFAEPAARQNARS